MPLFVVPSGVACQPVFRNPLSTKNKSHTTVASKVASLDQLGKPGHRLQIKTSEHVWERAIAYVSYKSAGNYPTTAECNNLVDRSASKPAYQQAAALLHAEESIMMIRRPTILTSASSVQDEGRDQVVKILNASLQTRYRNQVAGNIADHLTYESPMDQSVDSQDMIDHAFYPTYIRPCPSMNHGPQTRDKAGYSDFILSKYPHKSGQVAVFEFKTFWNYTTEMILGHIYKDKVFITANSDRFQWQLPPGEGSPVAHELLKQVYGEHVFMGVDVSFFTNCDICFIAVTTKEPDRIPVGSYHDVMVLSSPKKWTDPSLHAALTGLSFMAIDASDFVPPKSMADLLCPANERISLGVAPSQKVKDILQEYGL
ncbi:hypothetical protein F5050DRAFT_707351 [Lentinula boryana]|uniref:Fungal-type protein kinase domain-containing protein n=1 Tax=Lentinula boryana TaxID=40481 RepID=A0ABQ8QNN5_9AGAR|nr:hypothetical protein F5050DRAFT_707351 [Lentinula boryana]